VLNEEERLRTLLPALGWTDEIVVVDGGSTDRTAELARRFGCRVAVREFDNYCNQRNVAIGFTSCDWVLSIDADEMPTPLLAEEIRQRIEQPRPLAYHVPIRSRIFGRRMRFSGTQDDAPIRLFRADSARWRGAVHEVLDATGPIGRLRNGIDHQTLPDLQAFLTKLNRYTSLEAEARLARGQRPGRLAPWIRPPLEVFRRLVWKQGIWDGPEGWLFCGLSGLSAWVLCDKHRRLWRAAQSQSTSYSAPANGAHEREAIRHTSHNDHPAVYDPTTGQPIGAAC
jgi:glycosyltransferase involved in cell wall biosynthesis